MAFAAGIGPGNVLARDIRLFEKLIAPGAAHDPVIPSDPSVNLKDPLKAA